MASVSKFLVPVSELKASSLSPKKAFFFNFPFLFLGESHEMETAFYSSSYDIFRHLDGIMCSEI